MAINKKCDLDGEIHLLQELCEHLRQEPRAHKVVQFIIYSVGFHSLPTRPPDLWDERSLPGLTAKKLWSLWSPSY